MAYRVLLSFLIFTSFSFAITQEAKDIKSKYKSLARDFLIYEYVKHKDTPIEDVKALKDDVYRNRGKIKRLFNKKLRKPYVKVECKKLRGSKYVQKCVKPLLTPKQVEKMGSKRVKNLYSKLSKRDKKKYRWVKSMMARDTFGSLERGEASDFLKVFNGVTQRYKSKVFDKYMKAKFAKKLSFAKGFDRFVMGVAMNGKYKKLPKSLTKLNPKKLSFNGSFYLGLMSLKQKKPKKALQFFKNAQKNTKRKSNKNKAMFWQYQITKDKKTLLALANGSDLNFYTFWAKEKLGLKNVQILQPKPIKLKATNFDVTDPFLWAKTNDETKRMDLKSAKKYAKNLYTKETIAHYTFILERASHYTKNYFITPYEEELKDVDKRRKTLIYSIGRQESRFVPASVSTSYALGPMQFMPFLARATAKDEGMGDFEYFDIFKPDIAMRFANNHFDFLENYISHPLLIAYAYNGGIGFTKKLLTSRNLFKKGRYEPFMSMEMVYYSESREYGKKVLVNYVLYGRLLGIHVDLFKLLNDLTIKGKAHRYSR